MTHKLSNNRYSVTDSSRYPLRVARSATNNQAVTRLMLPHTSQLFCLPGLIACLKQKLVQGALAQHFITVNTLETKWSLCKLIKCKIQIATTLSKIFLSQKTASEIMHSFEYATCFGQLSSFFPITTQATPNQPKCKYRQLSLSHMEKWTFEGFLCYAEIWV